MPFATTTAAGWRAFSIGETARRAAEAMAPRLKGLRAAVLADLIQNGASTPEEVQARNGGLLTSIRPRCSELARLGLVEDSGQRRPGEGGKPAIAWRVRTARAAAEGGRA